MSHQNIAVGHKIIAVGHKNINVAHKNIAVCHKKKQHSLTKTSSCVIKQWPFVTKNSACHKNMSRHPRSSFEMSMFWSQEHVVFNFLRPERSFAYFATNIETVRLKKIHFRRDLACSRETRAIKLSHFQIFAIEENLCDIQGQGGDDATKFLQTIFGMS